MAYQREPGFRPAAAAAVPLAESVALGELRGVTHEEHLGLRLAQERLHVLAELLHLLLIGRCQLGPGIGEAHVLSACRDRQRQAQQRDDSASDTPHLHLTTIRTSSRRRAQPRLAEAALCIGQRLPRVLDRHELEPRVVNQRQCRRHAYAADARRQRAAARPACARRRASRRPPHAPPVCHHRHQHIVAFESALVRRRPIRDVSGDANAGRIVLQRERAGKGAARIRLHQDAGSRQEPGVVGHLVTFHVSGEEVLGKRRVSRRRRRARSSDRRACTESPRSPARSRRGGQSDSQSARMKWSSVTLPSVRSRSVRSRPSTERRAPGVIGDVGVREVGLVDGCEGVDEWRQAAHLDRGAKLAGRARGDSSRWRHPSPWRTRGASSGQPASSSADRNSW